eukprot:TRINITY_DN16063_c0_g2_i1.p1 TRINITY_DN16063_c0_g2~~TRINITY_DN16063_c0_g2_i1.p1  ORF type:complete len:135 (+),score=0.72 TRINITY_DN16063_c0_g2_i1:42-407(+)
MNQSKPDRKILNVTAFIVYVLSICVALALNCTLFQGMKIFFVPRIIAYILGPVLMAAGIALVRIGINTVREAYESRTLVKTGVFAWIRHPFYAGYAFYFFLGLMLLLDQMAGLLVPIMLYF